MGHSTTILKPLNSKHQRILDKLDHLQQALQLLQYEGKLSFGKNIQMVQDVMDFFREEVLPHIAFDEDVIFPYLLKHIPKSEAMIRFLQGEHLEFHRGLDVFDTLLRKTHNAKTDAARVVAMEQLIDQGTYLICLLRNHIHTEGTGIYAELQATLKPEEKRELLSRCKNTAICDCSAYVQSDKSKEEIST